MSKLAYSEYLSLLLSEDTTDAEIAKYSVVAKGSGGFDFTLQPNPDEVDIPSDELAEENAMAIGNSLFRWRRARRFRRRIKKGVDLPVLVSEGDSWFQFPLLIKEVIDQLEDDYLIWSIGAAGDTAENMVFAENKKKKTEYMQALRLQKDRVKGFLFSAAGNDIIGEDPETNDSSLFEIIKTYRPGFDNEPTQHINFEVFGNRLAHLRRAYTTVIDTVHAEPGLEQLPIIIHGYDYCFPYPWDNDKRNPSYAAKDEWLGQPFAKRQFPHSPLRREILKVLIDALYDMLADVAGDSSQSNVWLVNCRGAMPNLNDWCDEIHGTSDGFAAVAERFRSVLRGAVG